MELETKAVLIGTSTASEHRIGFAESNNIFLDKENGFGIDICNWESIHSSLDGHQLFRLHNFIMK